MNVIEAQSKIFRLTAAAVRNTGDRRRLRNLVERQLGQAVTIYACEFGKAQTLALLDAAARAVEALPPRIRN